jgi:hypothetical protein
MAILPYRNDAFLVLQKVYELEEKVDKVDKKFDKLISILSEVLESMTKPVYGVQTEFIKENKKNGKKDKADIQ